mmetsp:Transcript_18594/g.30582  ORF Transcript_18594/g.30582 Transcript_18594/m.30582 type:complete len:80 (+) Transcript_18594:674-913(+)
MYIVLSSGPMHKYAAANRIFDAPERADLGYLFCRLGHNQSACLQSHFSQRRRVLICWEKGIVKGFFNALRLRRRAWLVM